MPMSYNLFRKWPGKGRPWSFSANKDKLHECLILGDSLVISCVEENGSATRFIIPMGSGSYFGQSVLPKLSFDAYNRCTFEINQETYQFTWRYKVRMDGRPYLV